MTFHWMTPPISIETPIVPDTAVVRVISEYMSAESALQKLCNLGALAALSPAREAQIWEKAAQMRTLDEIGRLEENWDGYGAAAIPTDTVRNAREILDRLEPRANLPNSIIPTSGATIAFEWESPLGGAYLEIGASTFGFYTSPLVGEPIMNGGKMDELDAEEVTRALATVVSSTLPDSLANGDMAVGF